MKISRPIAAIMAIATAATLACRTSPEVAFNSAPPIAHQQWIQQIETPENSVDGSEHHDLLATPPPPTVRKHKRFDEAGRELPMQRLYQDREKLPLSLEQCVQMAMSSRIIRDLGGRVLTSPVAASSVFDPAIQETNPLTGPEAALAAFDAQLAAGLNFSHDENTRNNNLFAREDDGDQSDGDADDDFRSLFGGTVGSNLGDFEGSITKRTAAGTQLIVRNRTNYLRNSVDWRNRGFGSTYTTTFSAEFRHPLLQGAGVEFNRIAGPNATPGVYNGVLIGRLNTDITLADFEASVRDMLRDVERTYWELYFAYRNLEARIKGRDSALTTWRNVKTKADVGSEAKEGPNLAIATSNYYLFQAQVEDALTGRADGTGGVFAVERQLRRLIGMPTSDNQLIVPATPATLSDVTFDWQESLAHCLMRRVELRRQQWNVKRAQLELIAARNFQRMRMDLVGQYNWRGFGDNLFGEQTGSAYDSAFQDLFGGNLQGWVMGLEMTTPVGNRVGHLAARNGLLRLRREQALLDEQQKQVVHELNAAFVEVDRAYTLSRTIYNRYLATQLELKSAMLLQTGGAQDTDFVARVQQRVAESESAFHRSIVDYNIALMGVNFARGTLLDNLHVYLEEGPWAAWHHENAALIANRFRARRMNYCLQDYRLSDGPYPQRVESSGVPMAYPAEPLPEGLNVAPSDLPRSKPGAPSDLPRSKPGAPSDLPRSKPGAPSDLPRSKPGAPSELPRRYPGAPSGLPKSPKSPASGNGAGQPTPAVAPPGQASLPTRQSQYRNDAYPYYADEFGPATGGR